jgi:hypothetical protein
MVDKIIDLKTARWRREDAHLNKVNAQIKKEIFSAVMAICGSHSGEVDVLELALEWTIVNAILLAHSVGMSREKLIQLVNDRADGFEPSKAD